MPLSTMQLKHLMAKLNSYASTPLEFIITLLRSTEYIDHDAMHEIYGNVEKILETLVQNPGCSEGAIRWAHNVTMGKYAEQIQALVQKSTGLQFSAKQATTQKLKDFDILTVAEQMKALAPGLWKLLGTLFQADIMSNTAREMKREKREEKRVQRKGREGGFTASDDESEAEYWKGQDDICEGNDDTTRDSDEATARREALVTIKKVVCLSIMMQSSNQRCNALQSAVGMFLESCNTPETVRELLAHMGISISTTAINDMVSSLSKESRTEIQTLGQSLLAAYAYDNLDIDLKHAVPAVEKDPVTLIHLTSGTLLPLDESITHEDLNCSEELWKKSRDNLNAQRRDIPPVPNLDHLITLHPEEDHPSGLLRRDRFNAWIFLRDLVEHGPEYFRRFSNQLGTPEPIEMLPVKKTKQVPLCMMDINPATPAGNGEVQDAMFGQTAVGDPEDSKTPVKDIGNHVVLEHGDLGVGQHLESLLESRAAESTPWRRQRFIVYVMGLFHLKMACADAIWRIFIKPPEARNEQDLNTLIRHVSELRPKETGKIITKPGFRRMHEIIQHVGIVSRLGCWNEIAMKISPGNRTLEEFAATMPTWIQLQNIANQLSTERVAQAEFPQRHEVTERRDIEYENLLLRQQYFLLYEEMSYALNTGDIGRVEDCFLPWAFIFRGCGKHKYAKHMVRHLHDLYFVYPDRLKRAVRLSMLCNPTGQPGKFRAIDWLVEHNNLYLKRIYGGKYSNHTKARILKQSPLIEVFKNTRIQFEKMFTLDHRTIRHSPPRLQKTFSKLANYMKKNCSNTFVPGRAASYSIPDVMGKGMEVFSTTVKVQNGDDADDMDWEDVDEPVEDDGDLDV